MHPEILRQLAAQHDSELRARARKAGLARTARHAARHAHVVEEFVTPAIPDYVDGSFRETPADAKAVKQRRIPAGRDAA